MKSDVEMGVRSDEGAGLVWLLAGGLMNRLRYRRDPAVRTVGTHARAITKAFIIGAAIASMSACIFEDLVSPIDFENQTDEVVWVGYNGHGPEAFRIPDSLWTRVPPGERETIMDPGSCLMDGELVVATQPDESSVIDVRPIGDSNPEVCQRVWQWSGVGDHD